MLNKMQLKNPKNTEKYFWTEHSIYKMHQYGLSAQRILRVIRAPYRKEEGIVPKTIAVMQPNKQIKHTSEIWVMYQYKIKNEKSKVKSDLFNNRQLKIISAWRYPGVSPKRNPIPEDILNEIAEII